MNDNFHHQDVRHQYIYAVHESRRSRLIRRRVAGRRNAEWADLLGPDAVI